MKKNKRPQSSREADLIEQAKAAVSQHLQKRNYKKAGALEEYIDSQMLYTRAVIEESEGEGMDVLYGYMGAVAERRKRAVYSKALTIGIAAEVQKIRGLESPEEALVRFEIEPHALFEGLDLKENLILAASIWVLDELRRCGKLRAAYALLPRDYADLPELPLDFYSPCYDGDLIRSVMYLFYHRTADGPWPWVTDAERERGSWTDSLPEPPENPKTGEERFSALMALLDAERVKRACVHFSLAQKDVTEVRMRCQGALERSLRSALVRFKTALEGSALLIQKPDLYEEAKLALDAMDTFNRDQMALIMNFDDLMVYDRNYALEETGSREMADLIQPLRIEDPYEICFAMIYLLHTGSDEPWLFRSAFSVLYCVGAMLPWHTDGEAPKEWAQPMSFEQGGWLQKDVMETTDWYNSWYNGRNLAQIVYDLTRSVVPRNLHPLHGKEEQLMEEEDLDPNTARTVTETAELLYLNKFQAQAANLNDFEALIWADQDSEKDTGTENAETEGNGERERESGLKNEKPAAGPTLPRGGFWGAVAQSQRGRDGQSGSSEETNKTEKDRLSKPERLLQAAAAENSEKKLKSENKGLRRALSEMNRSFMADKAKSEQELAALRREHRELADLRELVFRQEQPGQTERSDQQEAIQFPYEPQLRTVVFGGHENFVKAIRPMLPGVRFVSTEMLTFSPDLIRNTDVVWVQTNHISHAQYGNIMNYARQYGVQVRYFTRAGAGNCAEQLAMEDRRSRQN